MTVKSREIEPWLKACRRLIDMDGDELSAIPMPCNLMQGFDRPPKSRLKKLSEIL